MSNTFLWREVTDFPESLPPTTIYHQTCTPGLNYGYWSSEDVLICIGYKKYDVAQYSEDGSWIGNLVNYSRDKVKAWAYIPKWVPKE